MLIFGNTLGGNWFKIQTVNSAFLNFAISFRNSFVLHCTAAKSGAAMRRKEVNTELFREWLSQHIEVAL